MNTTHYLGKEVSRDHFFTVTYRRGADTVSMLLGVDDAIDLLYRTNMIQAMETGVSFSTSYVHVFAARGRRKRVRLDALLYAMPESECMQLVWYHERLKELHEKGYQQMLAETSEEMRLTRLALAKNRKALGL